MLDSTVLGTISSQYVPSMYRRPRWRNKRGLKREGVRERERKERNRESGEGEKCIRGGGEKGREKRRLGGASLIIAIKPRR